MDAVGAMADSTDNCFRMFFWHCVLFLLWKSKFMLSWHMVRPQDHLHLCLSLEDMDPDPYMYEGRRLIVSPDLLRYKV